MNKTRKILVQYTQVTHIKTRKVHTHTQKKKKKEKKKKIREYIFRVITCIININSHIKKIQQHSFDQGIRLIFIYQHQFYTSIKRILG